MPEIKQCTLQIEELRIGNLVNYKGKPVRVDIHVLQEVRGNNCDYTPIELTEEILSKAENKSFEFAENICIYILPNGVFMEQYGEGREPLTNIMHLHQLQNIIHSLTGQELKVNLTL